MSKKRTPVSAYRSAMVKRFGPLYHLMGFGLFFRRLTLSEDSVERIREAEREGAIIVYAMRTRSIVDYWALNKELAKHGLPLSTFGTGVSTVMIQPVTRALAFTWRRFLKFVKRGRLPHPVESGWLTSHLAEGNTSTVFLRAPAELLTAYTTPAWPDPVPAVMEAQAQTERTIKLFPVVVIWARSPERAARNPAMLFLFGTEEEPGIFWRLFGMLWGQRRALVQVGEPVAVTEFVERYSEEPPRMQAKRLRLMLRRWCFREQQVVRGPRQKSHRWIRRLVLGSKKMQGVIAEASREEGVAPEVVEMQLARKFDKMAARFSYTTLIGVRAVAAWILGLLYKEIDIRDEDLERIRTAKREGVAVIVPCHRSHLDYILVSSVLWDNDITPPHVVAGENLSFFPFGALLRRSGAFFIPRRFTDKKFIALFSAYITQLFREGYSMEFFIEGGRSRTGKLLRAKLGVLRNSVEAGVESRVGRSLAEVSWLPVNIAYERVAEENPYRRELGGEKKAKESLGEVVKASKVLFQRHGRVTLRVGEPIKLSELMESWSVPWGEMNREQQREVLNGLGEEILWRINTEAVVLPSGLLALSLLAGESPDMSVEVLESRLECFHSYLQKLGAISAGEDGLDYGPLQSAARRFVREKFADRDEGPDGVVYRVDPAKRITLEYYKNGIVHFFVPASLLATVIRAHGVKEFSLGQLTPDVMFLLFLLRYEFIHDPSAGAEDIELEALSGLEAIGVLSKVEGDERRWRVESDLRVGEFAEITANFLESYDLALAELLALREEKISNLAKEIQKFGRKGSGVGRRTALAGYQGVRSAHAVHDLGGVGRLEALSLINIQNALKAFREDGLFEEHEEEGLTVDELLIEDYRGRLEGLMGDLRGEVVEGG